MTSITRPERVLYGVILIAALVVVIPGLLAPASLAETFSWFTLPPLHAQFLGAIYLWGAVYMIGCLFARSRSEVRWAVPLIGIFTGMLFVVSVLNLGAFDFKNLPVLIWFASYLIYPPVAAVLFVRSRREPPAQDGGAATATWARGFLLIQGIVVTALAIVLFLVPQQAAANWPWKVTPFLAQAYSGPLLAYGIGSLLAARSRSWREIRTIVPGMLAFTAATLVASAIHADLFSASDLTDLAWFAALVAATLALAAITFEVLRHPAAERVPAVQ